MQKAKQSGHYSQISGGYHASALSDESPQVEQTAGRKYCRFHNCGWCKNRYSCTLMHFEYNSQKRKRKDPSRRGSRRHRILLSEVERRCFDRRQTRDTCSRSRTENESSRIGRAARTRSRVGKLLVKLAPRKEKSRPHVGFDQGP